MRFKLNKKGFTLVEVIVTLVVLAILIALSIPSIMKYIDDSKEVTTLLNARSFYTAVQSISVKEYGDANAYSDSSDGPKVTYEAITNTKARPNDDPYNARIRKIYDQLDVANIEEPFEAIAIVEKGEITIMRFKDLKTKQVYEWKKENQNWIKLKNINESTPWAGEILPDSYTDRNIWWNGYSS